MIISCEKCNKRFELDENLIPDKGRLLQCGSCSHKWHFIPERIINLNNEVSTDDNLITEKPSIKKTKKIKEVKKSLNEENFESKNVDYVNNNNSIGFLSYLLIISISFIAILLIVVTFKTQISILIPNIDFYLSSLYESLKDIYLFFNDLLN